MTDRVHEIRAKLQAIASYCTKGKFSIELALININRHATDLLAMFPTSSAVEQDAEKRLFYILRLWLEKAWLSRQDRPRLDATEFPRLTCPICGKGKVVGEEPDRLKHENIEDMRPKIQSMIGLALCFDDAGRIDRIACEYCRCPLTRDWFD